MENYIIANRTDVGRARQVNEDNMTTFDSPNGRVIAVCDGMGGQAAGDVASKLACDIIRDILENNVFADPGEAITRAVMAANQGILHRASQSPELEGMGSTCVMLIIKDNVVTYGWVGDSRIYILANHTLRQISRDQSYVQMLVDQGELSAEEAENHPQKNEIVNALGVENMTPPEIGQEILPPVPGTMFLLCSDGLTNMVGNQQIEHELNKPGVTLQDKADKLVFLANQYGGTDNITVQLVEFGLPNAGAPAMGGRRKGKGRNNTALVVALAVLVVLLVGVAAYLMLYGGGKKEVTPQPQPKVTNTVDKRDAPKAPAVQQQTPPQAQAPKKNEKKTTTTKPEPKKDKTPQGALEDQTAPKSNDNADKLLNQTPQEKPKKVSNVNKNDEDKD